MEILNLEELFQELEKPNSWHWKINIEDGWFKHHTEYVEESHIRNILARLEKEAPTKAVKLRAFLNELLKKFTKEKIPAAAAVAMLLGVVRRKDKNLYQKRVVWLKKQFRLEQKSSLFRREDKEQLFIRNLLENWNLTQDLVHHLSIKGLRKILMEIELLNETYPLPSIISLVLATPPEAEKHLFNGLFGLRGQIRSEEDLKEYGQALATLLRTIYEGSSQLYNRELEHMIEDISKNDLLIISKILTETNRDVRVIIFRELMMLLTTKKNCLLSKKIMTCIPNDESMSYIGKELDRILKEIKYFDIHFQHLVFGLAQNDLLTSKEVFIQYIRASYLGRMRCEVSDNRAKYIDVLLESVLHTKPSPQELAELMQKIAPISHNRQVIEAVCEGLSLKNEIELMNMDPQSPEYKQKIAEEEKNARFENIKQLIQVCNLANDLTKLNNDPVFGKKLIADNIRHIGDLKKKFSRLNFEKTGSDLIPLGGSLIGYLIRIIPEESFRAWRVAFEAGIPTEPLFKRKTGEYRAVRRKDGKVAVITKYCGVQLEWYKRYEQGEQTLFRELDRQKENIISKMNQLGIAHGHSHDGNFVIEFEDNKPVLRIIDFDIAYLVPARKRTSGS
ncbi:hypothetical protein GOV10_03850 [Candidatus Woesearchaeota archaeon]|nr:hypothetical protein [Candidatus Woesearchaeota archaeon]